ncbi:MAG TPA: M20 family peptidase [Candidatus Hydrogenedentes bacterium]|nr:M20 family peptidase [Candidatus Hydrogenedentota bacterium]HPG67835.1 M20 family peptidase [Candidatus Hydrogenedentota bacterium]
MTRRIGAGVILALALLLAVALGRTMAMRSLQLSPSPFEAVTVDGQGAVERLSAAIRCRTISYRDRDRMDASEFRRLHEAIQHGFPNVHAALDREVVNDLGLLYTWHGRDEAKAPFLFLAHMDVVPASEDDGPWRQPPFSGAVTEGCVWGRGAVDDKGSMLAILEAVEALLASGFRPARTLYLAFGCDEEVGGDGGAGAIAARLASRGIRLAFCLDEGLVITDGIVPGMARPLALVAVAEKGYLTVNLDVKTTGGHSSQPPAQTAIGILAKAITRLEEHPFPAALSGPARAMFEYAGPEMGFPMRLVFANLWLFRPLVQRQMEASPATNAGLRTTTAATIFRAGETENVLPAGASAAVNFRLLPGDSVEEVLERVCKVIDDPRVSVAPREERTEPSKVSDHTNEAFRCLSKSIRQVWPEVSVAPGLQIGGTDSKHYVDLADDLYRFSPFWFTADDLDMIHGVDERVAIDRYLEAIQFYAQVIRNAQ